MQVYVQGWAAVTNLPYPVVHADYQKNQPTRKLTQAAGKNEGDANIFPSTALQLHVQFPQMHVQFLQVRP